jgi:hypothetical protein
MAFVVPIVTKLTDAQRSCMSVGFAGFRTDGARNVENAREKQIDLLPGKSWLPLYLFLRN